MMEAAPAHLVCHLDLDLPSALAAHTALTQTLCYRTLTSQTLASF
jgi:hypothetical protein